MKTKCFFRLFVGAILTATLGVVVAATSMAWAPPAPQPATGVAAPTGAQAAQAIIVNHTCTDLSRIPPQWIEQARRLTFHYAHTSHGSQIVSGLEWLEGQDSRYDVAILYDDGSVRLPDEPDALRIYDGNNYGFDNTYITPDMYWSTADGRQHTNSVADTGLFGFSMWSWCGQQSDNTDETVNDYLARMAQFEAAHPGMRFILMTGHTDGGSDTLEHNNNLVRQYATAQGMVLFDFADIETYDPSGGGPYTNDGEGTCTWCVGWCNAHPTYCADLPDSCEHSENNPEDRLFCKLKAQAFWWMMARLAGWSGTPYVPGGYLVYLPLTMHNY